MIKIHKIEKYVKVSLIVNKMKRGIYDSNRKIKKLWIL